ncbi:GNAT family N-acetyltransferase [Paenibacillus donghaensis]|jgi:GNAT superfamily N-acetyltransferase|uniref:GNAT family N-acetyltransferase n=1 Tax=Paenibacillus donghaensis TaxID=414771 RepID=UPI00188322A4|nr:GNAT family N-acetyltransferase [Paenibacillus donghaensis]MBE9917702.1 GNAT family N-acetyltransferase [Paenibacillus donghaensis]
MSVAKKIFTVIPMMREHAEVCSNWKYEPPYDRIYSWLPWEQMEALGIEFGDPDIRERQYVSIMDAEGILCGFAQLFPMVNVIRLGVGLRPDLCDLGMGKSFLEAIVAEAKKRYPELPVDLEVQDWNQRAIRAYLKAGFEITDTYEKWTPEGLGRFHCMVYREH